MFGSSVGLHVVVCCTALAGAATVFAGSDGQTASQKQFLAAGKNASLTVAPTVTAGQPFAKVGEAVAMTLERCGMSKLETSTLSFTPPKDADLEATANAFAAFVKANPPTTDYILLTEFQGTPGKGVSEVRAIVATKNGEIVWKDRQAPGDKDFDRLKPREPIQCCMLVAERLRLVLKLDQPSPANASGGRIAERWRHETGIPDRIELAAMEARAKEFKSAAANGTLIVYPVRMEGTFSAERAASVAASITNARVAKAASTADGPRIAPPGDVNEQKMLWAMARSLSEHVKKNRPEADYVLFGDYLMNKNGVFAVHFAVCNRKGELVAVEHQNRNTAAFKAVNPRTGEDCDKLLVNRVAGVGR